MTDDLIVMFNVQIENMQFTHDIHDFTNTRYHCHRPVNKIWIVNKYGSRTNHLLAFFFRVCLWIVQPSTQLQAWGVINVCKYLFKQFSIPHSKFHIALNRKFYVCILKQAILLMCDGISIWNSLQFFVRFFFFFNFVWLFDLCDTL